MAVTILQSPTNPNMANANLVYEVSSTVSTAALFQYVLDIQDENRNVLQRIKQQPNPSGYGVFDIGKILPTFVSPDPVWKTEQFATSSYANKEFWVAFGEEWAVSTSGSVVLYNGVGAVAGPPAKSGSNALNTTDGLVEPNSGDWNFDYTNYYAPQAAAVYNSFNEQVILSNASTTQKIQDGEYLTLSVYNGNFDDSPS